MVLSKKLVAVSVLAILVLCVAGISYAKVYRPAAFVGEPPDKELGYRVWLDNTGWHLRWTTEGRISHFSGKIECDRPIHSFHEYKLEPNDRVIRKPRFVKFNTQTSDGIDGIDFNTDAKRIALTLKVDGRAHRELIHVGRHSWNPKKAYIVITR